MSGTADVPRREEDSPAALGDLVVKPLRCLTLHQPWATFIALGLKTCETRTHDRFRSLVGKRIGIHAGLAWDRFATIRARRQFRGAGRELPPGTGSWFDVERLAKLHTGHLIATVLVRGHRRLTVHDSEAALCDCSRDPATGRGLWGLDLDELRTIEPPVKVGGAQGVWYYNG